MKFKIIPNEQTQRVELCSGIDELLSQKDLLLKYLIFVKKQHKCAGLAANQVSVDGKRMLKTFFAIKDRYNRWSLVLCPKINKYYGKKEEMIEGCLTWLGKKFKVKRAQKINVSYYDINGIPFEETIDGFEAQVWQHECDHLNGVVENIVDGGK